MSEQRVDGYMLAGPYLSEQVGLEAKEHGFLMCLDENGERCTLIGDPAYVRMISDAPRDETEGLDVDLSHFPLKWKGWPGDSDFGP